MKAPTAIGRRMRPHVAGVRFRIIPVVLAAFFVVGAVAGTLLSRLPAGFPLGEGVVFQDGQVYAASGFFGLLLSCAKHHLLVLALGTSLLGVAFIPAVFAVRGFTLACTAATILLAYPEQGVLLSFVVLGLPSLLTVPSLFVLGYICVFSSTRLIALCGRRTAPGSLGPVGPVALFCAVSLIFAAAIQYSIVPVLVKLIVH